ncbi:TIR domain-containing protein [Lachnospira multipara]|uniref:TIR domain-containing protein n=1 Tax=Lachnospira multipara TaxID=28051 RepID=UPI00040EAF9F|nr:molecular chaperone Tir [Lachnospira multipara]
MYRTKTYLAGDWTGDQNLISQLYKWNNDDRLLLDFVDAHELTQARDTSLACSIKRSLSERLNASKTFVLIVGKNTDKLTKGACRYCNNYSSYFSSCTHGSTVDQRSFIEYECEKAKRDNLKIVVLYNYTSVYKDKCPECLRYTGTHLNAYYKGTDGKYYLNYQDIKKAIMN